MFTVVASPAKLTVVDVVLTTFDIGEVVEMVDPPNDTLPRIVVSPLELIDNPAPPPVVKATWLLLGENNPVSLSPTNVKLGAFTNPVVLTTVFAITVVNPISPVGPRFANTFGVAFVVASEIKFESKTIFKFVAETTRPFESNENEGIADKLPYVPATTPDVGNNPEFTVPVIKFDASPTKFLLATS